MNKKKRRPYKRNNGLQYFLFLLQYEKIGDTLFSSLKELAVILLENKASRYYCEYITVNKLNSTISSLSRTLMNGNLKQVEAINSLKKELELAIVSKIETNLKLKGDDKAEILAEFHEEFNLFFYFKTPKILVRNQKKFEKWRKICKEIPGGHRIWNYTLRRAAAMEEEIKKGTPFEEVVRKRALMPKLYYVSNLEWNIEYWSVVILYQCWQYGEHLASIPKYKIFCTS